MALIIAPVLQTFEKLRVTTRAHFGITEFALVRALHLTAKLFGHGLHAVADAEHGNTQFEDRLRCLPVRCFIHRVRTTRQDNALRFEFADEVITHIKRMQFTINLLLTHTACDQLR